MYSRTAEHALRALLFLARREGGAPVPVDEIADAIGAPRNYLSKTLGALTRQGVVSGTRGPRGGFRLERPAEEITVAQVIELFDAPPTRGVCLLGGRPCTDARPCQAHFRWKAVWEEALAPLRATTVADLVGGDPPARATG